MSAKKSKFSTIRKPWNQSGMAGERLEDRELKTSSMDMGLDSMPVAEPTTSAAFVKFEGVDGESIDKDHGGWSDILSFSEGTEEQAAGFVKYDGIDGESLDKDHGGWSEILSFDQGTEEQAAGFVKYDGIDGESLDKDHGGWSDILSFDQPITKPATGDTDREIAVEETDDAAVNTWAERADATFASQR